MKKCLLISALAIGFCIPNLQAQTVLLNEGFEGVGNTDYVNTFPEGWTTVDEFDGSCAYFKWCVGYNESATTMKGQRFAYVDGPTYAGDPKGGLGPRTEKLLTPELNLNDTYRLSFIWKAAYHSAIELRDYDLHVYVIDQATGEETRIFTFSNEQELRDSGVPCDMYDPNKLWTNWGIQSSQLDLSQFEGKRVKIAFVYQMYHQTSNALWIDDVKVEQAPAETSPIAQISDTEYNFGQLYLGEKMYSTLLTIKNVGKSGLKITGYEAPEGIGVAYDPDMDLTKNQEGQLQLWYKAALTTPVNATVKVKTNGGDIDISVSATKTAVPNNYQLELFEGNFPPAGWSTDWWSGTPYALEGDQSAVGRGYIEDTYLYSPRMDLSAADAPTNLYFTYFNSFDPWYDDSYCGNDITVEVSKDGGETWSSAVWTTENKEQNILETVTVNLSAYKGENDVRVRWHNSALYYDPEYGADESSTFYLDRVLLPSVYGMNNVPIAAAEPVKPVNEATEVLPRLIYMEWSEAQFAEGYRLYVGTSEGNWDVLNGLDKGTALTHELKDLAPATTYKWKVVPYNAKGDAENVPVWSFTTQEDATVHTLPWLEGFEGDIFPPKGWEATKTGYSRWSQNTMDAFDGRATASGSCRSVGDVIYLTSPDIELPAGESALSFWWGNGMNRYLLNDVTTVIPNPTTGSNGEDETYLDIYADGEWHEMAMLSDPNDEDHRYWIHEQIDLTPYAGKKIAIRFRYTMLNYSRAEGVSIDNVGISNSSAGALNFSTGEWYAFKVNFNTEKTSDKLALNNFGTNAAKVKSVTFDKDNFTSTLAEGTEIAPNSAAPFYVKFNALTTCSVPTDSVEVKSAMVVTMEDGRVAELPVRALALGKDIKFYDFENDATGQAPSGFTVFDDGAPTNPVTFWTFPNRGSALSFFVLNESECYSQMKCETGQQGLMSLGSQSNSSADDWLISEQMTAGAGCKVKFDARSWESVNSILPGNCSKVSVWVSENSNTNKADFVQVGSEYELSLYNNIDWEHLEFDLSAYAGKQIYVAIRNVINDGLGSFFDNVEYVDVNPELSGIHAINALDMRNLSIYTADGVKVGSSAEALQMLPAGLYIATDGRTAVKVMKR